MAFGGEGGDIDRTQNDRFKMGRICTKNRCLSRIRAVG